MGQLSPVGKGTRMAAAGPGKGETNRPPFPEGEFPFPKKNCLPAAARWRELLAANPINMEMKKSVQGRPGDTPGRLCMPARGTAGAGAAVTAARADLPSAVQPR